MKLEGMKINFLGDSITDGHATTGPDKIFHQLIKEKYNLKCANNFGLGGTRIARQHVPSNPTRWDLTYELRADIMPRDVDANVVFGGVNDYNHGDAPFGEIDSCDPFTFCGAVNSLITKFETDFPNSKLIFLTPLHKVHDTVPCKPDSKILSDYVDAIVEICQKRNVAVIDLFKINPLDPYDKEYIPDGLHPNDAGHRVMAEVIAEELMKL